MKQIEEMGCKYLGILAMDKIMEKNDKKDGGVVGQTEAAPFQYKLNGRIKIEGINIWTVSPFKYGVRVIKLTVDEVNC